MNRNLLSGLLARFGAVGVGLVLVGCADDTPSTTGSFGTGGTGLADTAGQISATLEFDTGLDDTDDDGDSSSDSGSSDDGVDSSSDGDPVEPGQSQSAIVGAGTRASSSSYSVVFTFGQPTAHQGTHLSTNYQLQGGLIGANGSPPQ